MTTDQIQHRELLDTHQQLTRVFPAHAGMNRDQCVKRVMRAESKTFAT